jgi:acyl-CoA thioesterase FadM
VVEKVAIRYQDRDRYGHVNVEYMTYFESARIAYFRAHGGLGDDVGHPGDVPGL